VVYKITAKYDGIPYAAKELEKRRFMKHGVLDQKVDMEMRIMQQITHVSEPRWAGIIYALLMYCSPISFNTSNMLTGKSISI
jgi:hypothetical protein